MICKVCGNTVDPQYTMCPMCGNPVVLSGGNGFWDLVESSSASSAHPVSPVYKEKIVVKEVKKPAAIPVTVSAVLCLLCFGLLIFGNLSNQKTLNEIITNYEEKVSEQKQIYETDLANLRVENEILREELEEAAKKSTVVEIISHPTPETKPAGYISSEGHWLFGFQIQGSATSFQWEKRNEIGNYDPLAFSGDGIDDRYGLGLSENLQDGFSRLIATGLTDKSGGIYRCTVTTTHGGTTVEVELTIEVEDDTPENPTVAEETDAPSPTSALDVPSSPELPDIRENNTIDA